MGFVESFRFLCKYVYGHDCDCRPGGSGDLTSKTANLWLPRAVSTLRQTKSLASSGSLLQNNGGCLGRPPVSLNPQSKILSRCRPASAAGFEEPQTPRPAGAGAAGRHSRAEVQAWESWLCRGFILASSWGMEYGFVENAELLRASTQPYFELHAAFTSRWSRLWPALFQVSSQA